MSLGRRKRDQQHPRVAKCDLPNAPDHPFCSNLNCWRLVDASLRRGWVTRKPSVAPGKIHPKTGSNAGSPPVESRRSREFRVAPQKPFGLLETQSAVSDHLPNRTTNGDLLGLALGDVNFPGNRMRIQRAYTHGYFTTPNSHKSLSVDMPDERAKPGPAKHNARATTTHAKPADRRGAFQVTTMRLG